MAFSKAQALIKSLRWYHMGFAFLWAVAFAGSTYSVSVDFFSLRAYLLVGMVGTIVAVLAMAYFAPLGDGKHPRAWWAILPGAILMVGELMFYGFAHLGFLSQGLAAAAGLLVGAATGAFYVIWQYFFASEGSTRTALYIPLSAVVSAFMIGLLSLLPATVSEVCRIAVLPLLATWSLLRCLGEITPNESVAYTGICWRTILRDLWKPVFCVCAICLVWKLMSYLSVSNGGVPIALVGFSVAALAIALMELLSERGIEVLSSYQVLFPVITGAFLLPVLLGRQYASVLSGTLMFGFEIVNLLLIIACAVYANRHSVPSVYVYAVGVVPTFAFMLIGDVLGMRLGVAYAYDASIVVNVLFLCVFLLSFTMFLVSWRRNRERGAESDCAAPSSAHVSSDGSTLDHQPEPNLQRNPVSILGKLDALDVPEALSQREREVVELLARGQSVAAISKRLYISENTVRGHSKSIYRKLGVHSRQQLIDLLNE